MNLRLEVGVVAANGLHEVRSVIADLRLADDVEFVPTRGAFDVSCEGVDVEQRRNLAWRAAMALRPELRGWRIRIRKLIPTQSGLGGGSADAATVLRGVSRIMESEGIPIVDARLRMIAPVLGSDVSACLTSGLKIVEGTGERVTPVAAPVPAWGVVLLQPDVRVPTAEAYKRVDRTPHRGLSSGDLPAVCAAYAAADLNHLRSLVHNDFQPVIEEAFGAVRDARERLLAIGAAAAWLCGSGSCVAGLFETASLAEAALARLRVAENEWAALTGFVDASADDP